MPRKEFRRSRSNSDAAIARRPGEQPVALETRRLLQTRRWLAAAPTQRPVRDAKRAGEPFYGGRLAARLGSQAMIDCDRD